MALKLAPLRSRRPGAEQHEAPAEPKSDPNVWRRIELWKPEETSKYSSSVKRLSKRYGTMRSFGGGGGERPKIMNMVDLAMIIPPTPPTRARRGSRASRGNLPSIDDAKKSKGASRVSVTEATTKARNNAQGGQGRRVSYQMGLRRKSPAKGRRSGGKLNDANARQFAFEKKIIDLDQRLRARAHVAAAVAAVPFQSAPSQSESLPSLNGAKPSGSGSPPMAMKSPNQRTHEDGDTENAFSALGELHIEALHTGMHDFMSPTEWPRYMYTSDICERCRFDVGAGDSVRCHFCPLVYHHRCLGHGDLDSFVRGKWACPECGIYLYDSKRRFVYMQTQLAEHKAKVYVQKTVRKLWKLYLVRKKFLSMQNQVVKAQSAVRRVKHRHAFLKHRRTTLRPVRVTVGTGHDMVVSDWDNGLSDPYIIISAVSKGVQRWRCDVSVREETLNPVWNETHTIPGVNGDMKLYFTVIDQDEIRDQFMGQGCLDLGDRVTNYWLHGTRGGYVDIALDNLIFMPAEASGAPVRIDWDFLEPKGRIRVKLDIGLSLSDVCGYMIGPPSGIEESTSVKGRAMAKAKGRKLWVSINDGELHARRSMGETKPRYVVKLHDPRLAIITTTRDGKPLPYILLVTKYSKFKFIPLNKYEIDRWRMAFLVSRMKFAAASAADAAKGPEQAPVNAAKAMRLADLAPHFLLKPANRDRRRPRRRSSRGRSITGMQLK